MNPQDFPKGIDKALKFSLIHTIFGQQARRVAAQAMRGRNECWSTHRRVGLPLGARASGSPSNPGSYVPTPGSAGVPARRRAGLLRGQCAPQHG